MEAIENNYDHNDSGDRNIFINNIPRTPPWISTNHLNKSQMSFCRINNANYDSKRLCYNLVRVKAQSHISMSPQMTTSPIATCCSSITSHSISLTISLILMLSAQNISVFVYATSLNSQSLTATTNATPNYFTSPAHHYTDFDHYPTTHNPYSTVGSVDNLQPHQSTLTNVVTTNTVESFTIVDNITSEAHQLDPLDTISTSNNSTDVAQDLQPYIYFRDTTRFWVQRVLVPIIMVVGVMGNSVTMLIMTRRRMRSSTNWYLAALAIFDMIYLIFTFLLSLKHYPNANDSSYYYYWKMYPYSLMITDASSNTSVWLTVTFTIERYIAVCHPIKGKVICTESRAKRVIFCVFIVCLSVTVPTPFEWTILERVDSNTNQTRMEAVFSELGHNSTYKNIYYHLNVILFVLMPLTLLVIFNTFLIRSVHESNKQRSKMMAGKDNYHSAVNNSHKTSTPELGSVSSPTHTSSTANATLSSTSRQEIRITIMLIAVVILFIICQTPTACILVYTTFDQGDNGENSLREEYILVALSNIFNFLMSLNAAGNFVLYCLLSQKYRRTFLNMFCPCLLPKHLHNQSTYPRLNIESSIGNAHNKSQQKKNLHHHNHHHHYHHFSPFPSTQVVHHQRDSDANSSSVYGGKSRDSSFSTSYAVDATALDYETLGNNENNKTAFGDLSTLKANSNISLNHDNGNTNDNRQSSLTYKNSSKKNLEIDLSNNDESGLDITTIETDQPHHDVLLHNNNQPDLHCSDSSINNNEEYHSTQCHKINGAIMENGDIKSQNKDHEITDNDNHTDAALSGAHSKENDQEDTADR